MLIKQIQIPVNLSHSIAYFHLLNNPYLIGLNNIQSELLKEGTHRTHDLLYGVNNTTRIEVKATGTSNFERFRQKAISSDLVIWLNIYENKTLDIAIFNPSILNAEGKIEVEVKWNNIIKKKGSKINKKFKLRKPINQPVTACKRHNPAAGATQGYDRLHADRYVQLMN